ncbi:MAG: hypothetical protein QXW10_01180, partial [Candidatus Micrarchaeaceae archaeon]
MSKKASMIIIASIFIAIAFFGYGALPNHPGHGVAASTYQNSITYGVPLHVPYTNASIGNMTASGNGLSFLRACACGSEISCGTVVYCYGGCPSDCPEKQTECNYVGGHFVFGTSCSPSPSPTNTASNSASSATNTASNSASGVTNTASNSASNGASRSSNSASNSVSNTASGAATVITTTTSIPGGCGLLPNSIVQQI